jgi:cell division protein FtsW
VILLFAFITWRAFQIGSRADTRGERFSAYAAYGLGLWIGMQAFINIGVNVGMLPT